MVIFYVRVTDGPRFRQKPKSIQADPGTAVNLVCDVDGNPPAEVTWMHGRDKVREPWWHNADAESCGKELTR